jgi:DNA-directed RNA polymerase specialized sigma24 family protein
MEDDHAGHERERFAERVPVLFLKVFGFVLSETKDRALAEDIAQETLVHYLNYMDKQKWRAKVGNLEAYLIGIARNLLKDRWRKGGGKEFVSLDGQLDDGLLSEVNEALSSDNAVLDVERGIRLEELCHDQRWKTIWKDITPEEKSLIYLHGVQGLSFEEIAVKVGGNVDSVRYLVGTKLYGKIRYRVKRICGGKASLKRKA